MTVAAQPKVKNRRIYLATVVADVRATLGHTLAVEAGGNPSWSSGEVAEAVAPRGEPVRYQGLAVLS